MQPRTALLLGNGKYAISLHQRLRLDGQDAVLTVALFPAGEAAVANADYCVDVLSPKRVIDLLKQHEITHVIFAGNFRLSQLLGASRPISMLQALGDPQMYNFMFNWLGGGSSYLVTRFCEFLQKNGFQPVAASERLPDLRPGLGVLVSAGVLSRQPSDYIGEIVARPALQVVQELDGQPWQHVRQAFLFEGNRLLLRDARGVARQSG